MASTSVSPDMTFINELYEEIENNPPGLEARKLLIQQFLTAEWNDSALGAAQEYVFLRGVPPLPPRSSLDLWVLLSISRLQRCLWSFGSVITSDIPLLLSPCLLQNFPGYFNSILRTSMLNLGCLYFKVAHLQRKTLQPPFHSEH